MTAVPSTLRVLLRRPGFLTAAALLKLYHRSQMVSVLGEPEQPGRVLLEINDLIRLGPKNQFSGSNCISQCGAVYDV